MCVCYCFNRTKVFSISITFAANDDPLYAYTHTGTWTSILARERARVCVFIKLFSNMAQLGSELELHAVQYAHAQFVLLYAVRTEILWYLWADTRARFPLYYYYYYHHHRHRYRLPTRYGKSQGVFRSFCAQGLRVSPGVLKCSFTRTRRRQRQR